MSSGKFDWLLSSLTPESQVPSTAEIIQKCLSVNPFELKFREANLQMNGQGPQGSSDLNSLPTTSGLGSMLSLPTASLPSLSSTHSPGIFSNIPVLTADIEGELRKTIDLSRKMQQLRENGLLSKQDDGQLKTPCTSDVLNAVLDMHMSNAQHQLGGAASSGSPFISSTSLIAGLKAALSSSTAGMTSQGHEHGNQLLPANSIPNFKVESDPSPTGLGDHPSFTPVSAQGKTMSSPDLHLASSALGLKQHSPMLTAETLMAFQSAASASSPSMAAVSSTSSSTLAVPTLNNGCPSLSSVHNSPAGSMRGATISPAHGLNGTSLTELTPRTSPMRMGADDPWKVDSKSGICPPQISISQQSPYSKTPDSVTSKDDTLSEGKGGGGSESGGGPTREKTRKYTKFGGGGADSQVSSTRGGRGRRSIINEMPPDERRMTILERNKAAAVRYRKRKKEEHDEMIGRVNVMEQEKNALETQNSVLRRELERLTFLLQERESRCVCKANQLQVGMSALIDEGRSPSVGFLNGYGGAQMRPGSSHSTQ